MALEENLALGDHVLGVAHDDIGERALARAVGTHQRVGLALLHRQVHAPQNLFALDAGVEIADDQLGWRLAAALS